MISMTSLRNNQKGIIWVFLIFFVMTLLGFGGSILGTISIFDPLMNALGIETRIDPTRAVGYLNGDQVPTSQYELYYDFYKENNRPPHQSSWAQFKSDRVINSTIDEMGLNPDKSNAWKDNFAKNTPQRLQQTLMDNGLYMNQDSTFDQSKFTNDYLNNNLDPYSISDVSNVEFNDKKNWSTSRILQIFASLGSANNYEIVNEIANDRQQCAIESISIDVNSVSEHAAVTDEQISERYDRDKDSKYTKSNERTVEYSFFNFPALNDSIPDLFMHTYSIVSDFIRDGETSSELLEKSGTEKISISIDIPLPKALSELGYERAFDKSLARKVFDDIDQSETDTLSTDKGIGVFTVIDIDNDDYIKLDDVKDAIRQELELENKIDWASSYLNSITETGQSLEQIADTDSLISYKKRPSAEAGKFAIGNLIITEQSHELLGMMLENDPGYSTEPMNVKGSFAGKSFNNIAIYKLLSKDNRDSIISSINDDDYAGTRRQILNEKSTYIGTNWQQSMLDNMSERDIRDEIY